MSKKKRKKRLYIIAAALVVFLGVPGAYYTYFFEINSNFREVVPGVVYRSAQPDSEQLMEWIDEYGLKTVINLRGKNEETAAQEKMLERIGVEMATLKFSAYEYPIKENLISLIEAVKNCQKPVLIHCRQGMDRSGTASAIAVLLLGQGGYDQAYKQAWMPPGPWKRKADKDNIHISDMFRLYEKYCEEKGLDINDGDVFEKWAREAYTRP